MTSRANGCSWTRGVVRSGRGFTIVELLVVMLIITIVIAIVLPALGGARNVAKNASTQTLMTDFMNAAARFEQDEGRPPGYFSAAEMGDEDNFNSAGLSAMENAMLDLGGGIEEPDGSAPLNDPNTARFISPLGPTDDNAVTVRIDLIGSGEAGAAYFTPPKKFFVAQGATSQVVSHDEILKLPDVVDAFGQPLLLWRKDTAFSGPALMPNESPGAGEVAFARKASDGSGDAGPGLFYWNANACFLRSTALGNKGEDQTSGALHPSLIGDGMDNVTSLAGILGHPGFPGNYDPSGNLTNASTLQDITAQAPRGSLVLQTAGKDGVYLSSKQAGRAIPAGADDVLHYGYTFFGGEKDDLMESFDDMLVVGGN